MSDIELLTKYTSMIPKIIPAINSIYTIKEATRQRIVITEAEELALDKAKAEYDNIERDIKLFDKLTINTNSNYKETEKLINQQFESIISALRKRQSDLLKNLENVKNNKIGVFEEQMNILKSYVKEYNDLNNKWDKIFAANDMDRNSRKQQIVKECDDTINKSHKLQNENKRIFGMINDLFTTRFPDYKHVKIYIVFVYMLIYILYYK